MEEGRDLTCRCYITTSPCLVAWMVSCLLNEGSKVSFLCHRHHHNCTGPIKCPIRFAFHLGAAIASFAWVTRLPVLQKALTDLLLKKVQRVFRNIQNGGGRGTISPPHSAEEYGTCKRTVLAPAPGSKLHLVLFMNLQTGSEQPKSLRQDVLYVISLTFVNWFSFSHPEHN